MKRSVVWGVVLAVLAVVASPPVTRATAATSTTPYIVVFKGIVTDPAALASRLSQQLGGQLGFVYSHTIKGFSVRLSPGLLAALQWAPGVAYVLPDTTVATSGTAK